MLRDSRGRCSHGSSVMAANIVESSQLVIRSANDDERFTGQVNGKKLSCAGDLIRTSNSDPVAAKNLVVLQAPDALVKIPGGWDGVSVFERRFLIVERQHIVERLVHSAIPSLSAAARLIDRCPRR